MYVHASLVACRPEKEWLVSRNHDLRPHVEALVGRPYSSAQMTYDLRRLRPKGLIHRIPNTHRYTATSYGLKVAFFNTKLYVRILRPNWPALLPEADPLLRALRAALDVLDREIHTLYEEAILFRHRKDVHRPDRVYILTAAFANAIRTYRSDPNAAP